jgi:hypothetical protein
MGARLATVPKARFKPQLPFRAVLRAMYSFFLLFASSATRHFHTFERIKRVAPLP